MQYYKKIATFAIKFQIETKNLDIFSPNKEKQIEK